MTLSTDSITVIGTALAVVVGAVLTFAYRYSDKSSKFDEKTQTDELNEIRFWMRSESTVKAIDKLYAFLSETKERKIKEGDRFEVTVLLYDTVRREPFNKILNEVEHTFSESAKIKQAWSDQKSLCARLGKILYLFAAVVAAFGFTLLFLSSQNSPFILSSNILITLLALFLIVCVAFIVSIKYTNDKIISSRKIYSEKRDKYLEEVKIEK
jgi:hypothetical protein